MGHLKTLSLKLLSSGLPLFLILTFLGNINWGIAAALTLGLIFTAYLLGDVYFLPATGNLSATIADGVLVFLLLWAIRYLGLTIDFNTIIYSAAAVVLVEGLFYHPYLKRMVSTDSMGPEIGKRE